MVGTATTACLSTLSLEPMFIGREGRRDRLLGRGDTSRDTDSLETWIRAVVASLQFYLSERMHRIFLISSTFRAHI